MSNANCEVMYIQNPALGAALLWRFACGYYEHDNRPVPFPVLFVVLPIIFRQDICAVIKGTRKSSGFSKVSAKLFQSKQNDSIHFMNNTSIQMRSLTLDAFNIASEANLLSLDVENATVFPLTTAANSYSPKGEVKEMMSAAEKLGLWCSDLTILEISKWLKVRF